jgi:hypothetical protein
MTVTILAFHEGLQRIRIARGVTVVSEARTKSKRYVDESGI